MSRRRLFASILIVILAIVIASILVFVYLPTLGGLSFSETRAYTIDPASHLQLTLTVNSANIDYGKPLSLTIDLSNTENRWNNVSAANNWPLPNLTLSQGCSTYGEPYGIILARGYLVNNLTLGMPLNVFSSANPSANSTFGAITDCPFHVPEVSYYQFHPLSDFAERYYYLTGTRMNTTLTLNGYWTGNGSFRYFDPGSYTLICGDEWGQLTALHIHVHEP
jgi:hypothetical protein